MSLYYRPLYQFALSLTRNEADACDLTQQTFYIWAKHGAQLRDRTKAKTWLFTTLHREYLSSQRRVVRFPHLELMAAEEELPSVAAVDWSRLDAPRVLEGLSQLEELYRTPVALFHLQDYSYREIAEVLGIPLGTVKSRLARGLASLQRILARELSGGPAAPARTP